MDTSYLYIRGAQKFTQCVEEVQYFCRPYTFCFVRRRYMIVPIHITMCTLTAKLHVCHSPHCTCCMSSTAKQCITTAKQCMTTYKTMHDDCIKQCMTTTKQCTYILSPVSQVQFCFRFRSAWNSAYQDFVPISYFSCMHDM